jgi:CHAT domain
LNAVLSAKGEGFFDIVHLDMHGFINSRSGKAKVLFSASGGCSWKAHQIKARKLAATLKKWKVRCVILNACLSAVAGEIVDSNMANVLVQEGIPSALGMSFNISSRTVAIFMEEFYKSLLQNRHSLSMAMFHARTVCREVELGRSFFGFEIKKDDSCIPVLRTSVASDIQIEEIFAGQGLDIEDSIVISESGEQSEQIDLSLQSFHVLTSTSSRLSDNVTLSAELQLSHSPMLILYGEAGSGKTILASYLSVWWAVSGFVGAIISKDFLQERNTWMTGLFYDEVKQSKPQVTYDRASSCGPTRSFEQNFERLYVVDNFIPWKFSNVLGQPMGNDCDIAKCEAKMCEFFEWFLDNRDVHRCAILLISRLPEYVIKSHYLRIGTLKIPPLSVYECFSLIGYTASFVENGFDSIQNMLDWELAPLRTLVQSKPLRNPLLLVLLSRGICVARLPLAEMIRLIEGSILKMEPLISVDIEQESGSGIHDTYWQSITGTSLLLGQLCRWEDAENDLFWLTLSLIVFRDFVHADLSLWIKLLQTKSFFGIGPLSIQELVLIDLTPESMEPIPESLEQWSATVSLLEACGFAQQLATSTENQAEMLSINPLLPFVLRWVIQSQSRR